VIQIFSTEAVVTRDGRNIVVPIKARELKILLLEVFMGWKWFNCVQEESKTWKSVGRFTLGLRFIEQNFEFKL
jgi:hypothetical protein